MTGNAVLMGVTFKLKPEKGVGISHSKGGKRTFQAAKHINEGMGKNRSYLRT
jgi:hypothetical protein